MNRTNRTITFCLALAMLAPAATPNLMAAELPTAIQCYQQATNSKSIDAYMNCFTADPVMIDVSRTITGRAAIKRWALAEVIPNGTTFQHRKIIESKPGFAKTEVKWMRWVVHYSYWWDQSGKITKMSLQYRD